METRHAVVWGDVLKSDDDVRAILERFGDDLAKRKKYKRHKGLAALQFFLVQEHHWLPATVCALDIADLRFLLLEEEEAAGWVLPGSR